MTGMLDRASAVLLLMACVLVGHLFMFSGAQEPEARQHAGMKAVMLDLGGMHADADATPANGESQPPGHAMAVTCLAVLAAGVLIYGVHRVSILRDPGPAGAMRGGLSQTWRRRRDLWLPPRADTSRVDGGVLLLI